MQIGRSSSDSGMCTCSVHCTALWPVYSLASPRSLDSPRPTLRSSCLRCLRGRGTTETASPFLSPPGLWFVRQATWPAGLVSLCTARTARHVPPSASLATDQSGRAGALCTASARSGHLVSTPAGKRGGLRGVAAHPPRFLRWSLAPGGSPRGAGWLVVDGALSLAPKGRSRRRERERADVSGRSVMQKTASSSRGCGRSMSYYSFSAERFN